MKKPLFLIVMLVMTLPFANSIQAEIPDCPVCSISYDADASLPYLSASTEDEGVVCADVNEDGVVNVLDIIAMVSYIMGGNPDPFNMEAADITADGLINILDVISMVNIILQVQGMPCGCVAPVEYEGQTYATVQIGEQCWMAENLNVGLRINSAGPGFTQTDNDIIEKFCYEDDPAQCDLYGGLYEWPEAMQYATAEGTQGVCPAGWHLPADGEWDVLKNFLGGETLAGGKMKETGTSHWIPPNEGATNSNGFTGLPGGNQSNQSRFSDYNNMGYYGYFWSSSQSDEFTAWERALYFNNANLWRYDDLKENGSSVRCLKN